MEKKELTTHQKIIFAVIIFGVILTYFFFRFKETFSQWRVEKQLQDRYGGQFNIVYSWADTDEVGKKTGNVEYTIEDQDGIRFSMTYSNKDGIISDDYCTYHYSSQKTDEVKVITDKYLDEYVILPNYYLHELPDIAFENSGSFEEYDAYVTEQGECFRFSIFVKDTADLSNIDDLIKQYDNAFSDKNYLICISQVPDDIYQETEGLKYILYNRPYVYHGRYDSSFDDLPLNDYQYVSFMKKFGTADFMYLGNEKNPFYVTRYNSDDEEK